MPPKPQKTPWLQMKEWVEKLGVIQKQMVEQLDSTIAENSEVENLKATIDYLQKYVQKQLTTKIYPIAKRTTQPSWSVTLEIVKDLKGHLDVVAEDTNVDTGLWGAALNITNRIIRLAKKESVGWKS